MKIRQGFVSNSSSASFIIKTKTNKKNVLRALAKDLFDKSVIQYNMKQKLESTQQYIESLKNSKDNSSLENPLKQTWLSQAVAKEKMLTDLIDNVNEDNIEEMIETYLMMDLITIKRYNDATIISNFVSMYNDLNDLDRDLAYISACLTFNNISHDILVCDENCFDWDEYEEED